MPNGPRRSPMVTRYTEGDASYRETAYSLRTDAGTKDFGVPGSENTPMVKWGAAMTVQHAPNQDAYAYRGEGWDHKNHEHSGSRWVQARHAASRDLMEGAGAQPKLFGQHHEEGHSHVEYMESTKSARVHAPMLLALAQHDTQNLYPGRQLGASEDRSDHSEKLVKHVQGKLGKQFEPRTRSNVMDFVPDNSDPGSPREAVETRNARNIVPQGEVSHARQTVRNMIRPPKEKRVAGPKQPKLPFG